VPAKNATGAGALARMIVTGLAQRQQQPGTPPPRTSG
jgi:hypothetical protein